MQWFLSRVNCPPRDTGDVWRHLWLSQRGGGCYPIPHSAQEAPHGVTVLAGAELHAEGSGRGAK